MRVPIINIPKVLLSRFFGFNLGIIGLEVVFSIISRSGDSEDKAVLYLTGVGFLDNDKFAI